MNFKKIFSFMTLLFFIGTPIFSFADDSIEENPSFLPSDMEVSSNLTELPSINARHSVIFDRNSKTILFGKNENEKCKMASTTKIMTAIIVIENCENLKETVTISQKAAATGGSRLGLSINDKITLQDLLYGLMMVSGNDAAVALSEFVGGTIEGFANKMNQKAIDLGLTSTHFVTPHGLDQEEHYTTAFELAKIADYALQNETFAKIVNTSHYTVTINGNAKSLHNTNELLGYLDGVYGVKTGFTNGANRCLVTSCKRGNLDIICVVLGCDTKKDRSLDSIELINYTFHNFSMVNIKDLLEKNFSNWVSEQPHFNINKGVSSNLDLYLNESQIPFDSIAVKKDSIDSIFTPISVSRDFEAPLLKNSVIGKMNLIIHDVNYSSIEILNRNTIMKKNALNYLSIFMENYLSYFCQ